MNIFCKNNLATKSSIETADGEINSNIFNQESAVIPLLCFADKIAKTDYFDLYGRFHAQSLCCSNSTTEALV